MASIIPNFEFDIFISYRQKDNKYDGWVNEFVDNLRREIDATFKEDVSIYFDENPHDGLLEIHNVNKSLETKLKSLIFIPIISQTYVDPKSFAWQNEFVAFNKMTKNDELGPDIKLANGYVCSRIIPIKIHDLDAADTELIETELGARLRSIDFIFKSAGVNRPLKPHDNPDKNLDGTYYRDQINKVANTIKDIIYSIHPDPRRRTAKSYQAGYHQIKRDNTSSDHRPMHQKKNVFSSKNMVIAVSALILVLALIFFIPKLINNNKGSSVAGKSVKMAIAILPVSNLTGNPDLDYIAEGIQDEITGRLGSISELTVRPQASTLKFRDSDLSVQDIAQELKVNNLVESSIKGEADNLKLEVRLIEAFPEEKYLWSSSFEPDWTNIQTDYDKITDKIINSCGIRLTSLETNKLSGMSKHDPNLYKLYVQGTYYMKQNTKEDFEKAIKCFDEAIAIDPSDPLPYLGLALGYSNSGHSSPVAEDASNRSKSYALQALSLDSTLADAHVVLATRYLYTEWNWPKTRYHIEKALAYNPNSAPAHYTYGWYLTLNKQNDDALGEIKKSVEIAPTDVESQGYLAWFYFFFKDNARSLDESRKLLQLDPNSALAYYLMGSAYSEMGMNYEAIEMNKKGLAISPGYESGLAIAYLKADQADNAEGIIKEMEKYSDTWWYAWGLAEVYSVKGDYEKAIDNLETAYKLHGDFVPWVLMDFYFKPLQTNPRFTELVKKLDLPV